MPDLAWDRNLRRWKRALEFADVPGRLLRANKNPKGQSAEIVYGNIDRVAQALRERTGNDDLSTTDVISFFVANPKPPRLRDFIARARERCYGWSNELRPLAPFDPDVAKAVKRCFNALGGRRVHRWELKTYADVFAGFHRRPEYKYDNGVGGASGQTLRRAVTPSRIDIISKETSRYAQQDQLAAFEPIQLASEGSLELLSSAVHRYGIGALARACGKSTDTVRRIVNGVQRFKADFVDSVLHFVETRAAEDREVELLLAHAKHIADREGLRCLAARLELQPSHLSEMLSGARPVSTKTRACLRRLPRPKAG